MAEKHLELHPDDAPALYLGAGNLVCSGERDRALEWVNRALAIDSEEPSILYNSACVFSNIGSSDKALDCLEKALAPWYRRWAAKDHRIICIPREIATTANHFVAGCNSNVGCDQIEMGQ